MPAKISVRKRAALKAWETRRANEAAGQKKNGHTLPEIKHTVVLVDSMRHEAALKAWDTRRAVKEELTPIKPKLKRSFAAVEKTVLRYDEKTEEILVQTTSGSLMSTGKFLKDYKVKLNKAQVGKMDRGCAAALKAWATRREMQYEQAETTHC